MDTDIDINEIMKNDKLFYKTVYTPLSEAVKILEERQKDNELIKKIENLLNGDIPEPLKRIQKFAINGKQVATPNYEVRWFLDVIKDYNLKPFFYEYHNDKFTSNNYFKHSLGQIIIQKDIHNKKNNNVEEKITIIDFNKSDGKPLKEIRTIWGESLIDFHKKLFGSYGYDYKNLFFFDGSSWLSKNGGKAINFYENDLLLYICHGILFENFLLQGKEEEFTKNVFLPAFQKVWKLTGVKPLIVPIPPMDIEIQEGSQCYSHDEKIKLLIKS